MKKIYFVFIFCVVYLTEGYSQHAQVPYFENFESGTNGWSVWDNNMGTTWQLGTPTVGYTIGAYSGTHCWDVNLNSGYTNNSICHLLSPIFDFTSVSIAQISFWTNYNTEYLWDYLTVQYTIDNGDSWIYLPFPELINPDGHTLKWTKTELTIDELYGYPDVQFRITFISDASTISDGYSIDDFRIEVDPLSTPAIKSNDFFTVYPNPSVGDLNFSFSNPVQNDAEVIIYNSEGQNVFQERAETLLNFSPTQHHLEKGIYTVVYKNNTTQIVKKLVLLD